MKNYLFKEFEEPEEDEINYEVDHNLGWYDKLKNKTKRYYSSGVQYENSYDYGFGRTQKQANDLTPFDDYRKTGVWRGYEYYKKSTIDYRYIEQIANAFSASHDIKIKIGRNWAIDLKNKELTYSPLSLMYGTKADVMASLLHEIGHLRFTTAGENIVKGTIGAKYPQASHKVLNMFEDIRIDERMRKAYAGAEGIFESNKETVKKIAEQYAEKSRQVHKVEKELATQLMNDKRAAVEYNLDEKEIKSRLRTNEIDYDAVKSFFGKDGDAFLKDFMAIATKQKDKLSLWDYLGGMVLKSYGHEITALKPEVQALVDKTIVVLPRVSAAMSTQEVQDILEADVFPAIEEMMKDYNEGSEEQKAIMTRSMAMEAQGNSGENNSIETRTGYGPSEKVPKEWADGDYGALKESVDSSIKELVRLLQNIKAKDLATHWNRNLKRGKIDYKTLYRLPSNRFDVFKKKHIITDRTQTFAFSIWVDTSGSMQGEPMIQATRGAIILAETLTKMDIPVEILSYEDTVTFRKKYTQEYKGLVLLQMGKLAARRGGGNGADMGLDSAELPNRPEKNKFVVALSDGEMDNMRRTKEKFEEYNKKGIHTIGIDISQRGAMQKLSMTEVREVEEAGQLPSAFVEVFKQIVKGIK